MKYSDLLVTMEETEDPGKGYSYENRVWSVIEVFNLILETILSPNVASVIRWRISAMVVKICMMKSMGVV